MSVQLSAEHGAVRQAVREFGEAEISTVVREHDEAIQVHGGAGYVTDHPVERLYRGVRLTKIYEATSGIRKDIIAERLP